MPGVFISYCRPSAQVAEQVAAALSSMGYEVWRDDQLPAHRAYGDVIEENLRAAKAVVVLWSADACQSQWVRAEADYARQAGVLVQASLDGTIPPLPFNQIQCADLSAWEGDRQASGWRKIEQSVAALAGTIEATATARKRTSDISICVLPFANMSGDAEQEYFSDGISEDITTDLSKVSALAVTARNTAFMFKGQSIDVGELARKLGVSHVLEGSVRKAGNRVRITAQLIDGRSGDHLWAERFDRDLTDIFAIQDEISKAIVDALKVKLLPAEKKAIEQRGTSNADAYNFYLMARKYWISGNYGDIRKEQRVIRLCQRALEIDPRYAQAWALMALAQLQLRYYFGAADVDASVAAEQALSIDPTIAEAYAVRARILLEAEQYDDANREIAQALKLDPDSWEVNREAARLSTRQRKLEDAARHYVKAVELIESDFHSWAMLVMCYQALGNREGVLRGAEMMHSQSEKVLAEDPSNGAALGICAGGHAIAGNRERAMETIERALLIDPDNLNMRYNFACVLSAYLNERDASLDLLLPVLELAQHTLVSAAAVDPDLDFLRGDQRFEEALAKAQARLGIDPQANPAAAT
ncbi:TIR domain-containing protein [Sphingomonas sp. NSE70-1]|uniref:TIR domain-containing protein n=1 Tax=Sphingomonas caseinilyticus TaxID=2908205 RepID=A0ABT0RSB4_9SPHN|nr:TIR domain-containing protein [Sphingomonas caseinilyticus]MCL6697903.1 TIR domain-containing protein [Sphingomonas caseinilyticus]